MRERGRRGGQDYRVNKIIIVRRVMRRWVFLHLCYGVLFIYLFPKCRWVREEKDSDTARRKKSEYREIGESERSR